MDNSNADGKLIFDTGIDTSGYKQDFEKLKKTVEETTKNAEKDFDNISSSVNKVGANAKNAAADIDKLNAAESGVNAQMKEAAAAAKAAAEAENALGDTASKTEDYFTELTAAIKESTAQIKDYVEQGKKIPEELPSPNENSNIPGGKSPFSTLVGANIVGNAINTAMSKAADATKEMVVQGVELASALTEIQNVVDVTFGDDAGKIYRWSEAASTAFGMSELQAQQFTGTLGAMLKSMGVTDDALVEMSTDMTGLAGDLASFYNLDIETAFEKIRSGISGETEPLKQLGINMSVANLNAYALAEGIGKTYEAMTAAEQATLRYNYLMSVTADAQGDFTRTSDSFANQQRILQLNLQNVSAEIGKDLLPAVNDLFLTINKNMPEILNKADEIGDKLGGALTWVIDNGDTVITIIAGIGTGVITMSVQMKLAEVTVGSLTAKLAALATAANLTMLGISALGAVLIAGALAFKNYVDNMDVSAPMDNFEREMYEGTEAIREQTKAFEELKQSENEKIEADIAETNNIARLWKELQNYTDENGNVVKSNERANEIIGLLNDSYGLNISYIDGQIQGYSDLCGSMDDYLERLRNESRIRHGRESYDEAVSEYDKLVAQRDELQKKETALYGLFQKRKEAGETESAEQAASWRNSVSNQIADLDILISEYEDTMRDYESLFASPEEARKSLDVTNPLSVDETTENKLKDEWDRLNHERNMGVIASDEELYKKRAELLEEYGDESNRDYWSYYEQQKAFQEEAAAAAIKAEKDKQAEIIKIEEKAEKERKKAFMDFQNEQKKQQEETIKKEENVVKDGMRAIVKKYQNAYDELERKRLAYKDKLMSIGGDIFSVKDVTLDTGEVVQKAAINNIDEQLKKMRDYHENIKKLRNTGASDLMIQKIIETDTSQGTNYAEYIADMTEEERKKLQSLYDEKQALADELSRDLYKSDAQQLTKAYTDELSTLSDDAYAYGVIAADEFTKGFNENLKNLGVTALYNQLQAAGTSQTYSNYANTSQTSGAAEVDVKVIATRTNIFMDKKKVGEGVTEYQIETTRRKGK